MAAAALDKEIKSLWPKLNITQKESIMHVIKTYVEEEATVKEIGCTISAYNKEIDEAEAEIDKGSFFSHDEVKSHIEEWKKKYAQ
jgi:predicted transcriptional regulator